MHVRKAAYGALQLIVKFSQYCLRVEEGKMGYMTVEQHTTTLLHLKRSPGIRSWSLLVGIASIGLAAAYYSS
ncbi:hypothetical protein GN956_G26386, partial [Arapaima gigas]